MNGFEQLYKTGRKALEIAHTGISVYRALTSSVGSFGGITFSVSVIRVLTPSNIKGSTSSEWATHNMVLNKAKSEYMGPGLKKYQFDLLLSAEHGVRPKETLEKLQRMAEEGTVDYFILNNAPVGGCLFKLTDVSDDWESVIRYGLADCTVSLTLEEYV